MIRDDLPAVAHAAASLQEALDLIGAQEPNGDQLRDGDRQLAKIICENELAMRELVRFALSRVAGEL